MSDFFASFEVLIINFFSLKMLIFSYTLVLTYVLGALKNQLIEMAMRYGSFEHPQDILCD